ncbi:MAG: hypothetical protein ACE5K0_03890 [Candidatus Methanofastidiosia archaeon]
MRKKKIYPHPVSYIRERETHISHVFLTGKYAYKVKKPVKFLFLDYSTLSKRRYFCERELEINKKLCGDMYIEVVPITKDGDVKIGGEGKVLEYALKMREIPQEYMMYDLLREGKITSETISEIARIVADFHKKASTDEKIAKFGESQAILKNCVDNFTDTRSLRGKLISKKKFDTIEQNTRRFLKEREELFSKRVREGRVRDIHGDLHSGNIFVAERIYIFDAIEFNPEINCTDVCAEVAFFSMDLDFSGRRDFSELFVKRYLELSGDEELLELLDFYKCYRAMVRAKVNSYALLSKKAESLVKKYFELAYEYALALEQKNF